MKDEHDLDVWRGAPPDELAAVQATTSTFYDKRLGLDFTDTLARLLRRWRRVGTSLNVHSGVIPLPVIPYEVAVYQSRLSATMLPDF